VGKTWFLKSLISLLCEGESINSEGARLTFTNPSDGEDGEGTFANLISVAFSAFDEVEFPASQKGTKTGNLYERALVNGGERPTYLAIRGMGLFGRCPLCAQRDVGTLDHYLPRTSFPEFAILPMNLVPCCFDCNHAKRAHASAALSEQMFHPYFDDWNTLDLIRATIEVAETVQAEFSVNVDVLPQVIADRAAVHFETLGLAALYSNHASVELVQRRANFFLTFENGGPEALRGELLRESQSRRTPFPNAWQPVLYRALANSDEFVNAGFLAIDQ
jgi:hypothetical protein